MSFQNIPLDCVISRIFPYLEISAISLLKCLNREYRDMFIENEINIGLSAEYFTQNIELLKWARSNNCPWNKQVCSIAAMNGHLEVLKWSRNNGCPWDEEVCSNAAMNGHLEVLKWARNNGCPWDKQVCVYAAMDGHLRVLKWARDNGCPE